jgi:type 1 glutamine amidotransferase
LNLLKAAALARFDAVMLVNTQGEFLTDPEMRKGFLDYVRSGKGLCGLHGAIDANTTWPEYADLLGANFSGATNWNRASVKIDDPASPLCAMFNGQGFNLNTETYTFRDPYSRDKLHILLSMDWQASRLGGGNRKDNDFAFSWIREYGKGRVFYCAFGHNPETFSAGPMLQHFLAGIQYALGDLKADATPSAKLKLQPAPAPPFKAG